ncbi:MAG: hypothetical protein LBL66_06110 [Clostridiales bacterium]|nr:hypothetical protein [Clostridiales bacterium]
MRGAQSATRQSLYKKARFVFCRDCPHVFVLPLTGNRVVTKPYPKLCIPH